MGPMGPLWAHWDVYPVKEPVKSINNKRVCIIHLSHRITLCQSKVPFSQVPHHKDVAQMTSQVLAAIMVTASNHSPSRATLDTYTMSERAREGALLWRLANNVTKSNF